MPEQDNTDEAVGKDEFDEPFTGDDPETLDQEELEALAVEFDRLETEVYELRGELSRFEQAVEDRTVEKPTVEADLRRYVRQRMRRSRARGWGPYLVLLYGTIMTIGGFYFLSGVWAILAMIVIWLSTLGLYVVMLAVGAVFNVLGIPSRVWDRVGRRRSSE